MNQPIFVADCRYIEALREAFGRFGTFVPSVPCKTLAEPESCHPDMALYADAENTVICAPPVYEAYRRLLSTFGVTLVQGKITPGRDYPENVAYNVLNAGGFAFAKWAGAEPQIVDLLEKRGIVRHHVAQGYARCSALAFADSVITADPSIARAAAACGLSVLQIEPGHICLPGYDYGFIGGASGLLDARTVGFFGDLRLHPNGDAIRSFITARGFSVCDVPHRPLTDVGTILMVRSSFSV